MNAEHFQQACTHAISPLRAEFEEPQVEADFRAYWRPAMVGYLRTTLVLMVVGVLVTAGLDYVVGGVAPGATLLDLARAVFLFAALGLWWRLVKQPQSVSSDLPAAVAILLGSVLLLHFERSDEPVLEHAGQIGLLFFGVGTLFPLTLSRNLAVHLYLAVGLLICAVLQNASPGELAQLFFLIVLISGLCLTMARTYHMVMRMQFVLQLQAEQATARLREEMAERARLEEELRHLACTDALTGLNNRRHFLELAEQQLRHSHRYQQPLAVCILDVDHFKRINDRYGHAAGDEALKGVAEIIRQTMREADLSGRLGGEEFALALPNTDMAGARVLVERLRQAIRDTEIDTGKARLHLTATIGVALAGSEDTDIDACLGRADDALYAGKEQGRDRVISA